MSTRIHPEVRKYLRQMSSNGGKKAAKNLTKQELFLRAQKAQIIRWYRYYCETNNEVKKKEYENKYKEYLTNELA